MKKLFFLAAVAAALLCSCTPDGKDNTNTVKMLGKTYTGVITLYQDGEDWVNFDQKPDIKGAQNIHGFHSFEAAAVGQIRDFAKDESPVMIAYNFNEPIDGRDHYYPVFKSGTVRIEKLDEGYWIYIDAKDQDGKAFFMDVLAQDELAIGGWGQFLD
jgi:hypothetical protein